MTAPRLNALIVAGEHGDAELAKRVLSDNGDSAAHCLDAPEALSRVSQEAFDLALVSLSMPRGDGLALVHHLRALYPQLHVVAMAGRDQAEALGSAMALGVLSAVVTPLTGDDVLVAANQVRERRSIEAHSAVATVEPPQVEAQRVAPSAAHIRDTQIGTYTAAYFDDVAERELRRAARHLRSFAVLTVALDADGEALDSHRQRAVAAALLSGVRDSDVVALRDANTFHVLLLETGLLGALACRRAIVEALDGALGGLALDGALGGEPPDVEREPAPGARAALPPSVGIGVFPADGEDLEVLLKLSARRAALSRDGLAHRLGLPSLGFWDALARLTRDDEAAEGALADATAGLAARAEMSESLVCTLAEGLIRDAARDGVAGVVYVAGDHDVAARVSRAAAALQGNAMRVWMLGPARGVPDPASHIRLPLTDARLSRACVLLSINERGGYCLVGRASDDGRMRVFHSCELEIVESLVSALQREYHLQPELR